jgi:hypothetical protein
LYPPPPPPPVDVIDENTELPPLPPTEFPGPAPNPAAPIVTVNGVPVETANPDAVL